MNGDIHRAEKLLKNAKISFEPSATQGDPAKYGARLASSYTSVKPKIALVVYLFNDQASLETAMARIEREPVPKGVFRDFSRNGIMLLVAETDISKEGEAAKAFVTKFLSAFAGEE